MRRRITYLLGVSALLVVALTVTLGAGGAAAGPSHERDSGARHFISESSLLAGLSSNALFPFIDTTPNRIERAHIAITDATSNCSAGAAAPSNIQVLAGQAGGTLVNVMTAATNTGIGSATQCVFHVTVQPGTGGIPAAFTDIVVKNAGGAALTGINTVTASATVRSDE
jgi:hypothetical protein